MEYTPQELAFLFHLTQDFRVFVKLVGLDPDHHSISRLLSPNEREPHFTLDDRDYIVAWAAWTIAYQNKQTLFWTRRLSRDRVTESVMALYDKLPPKMVPRTARMDSRALRLANGSRLLLGSTNPDSSRGCSLSHAICEDVDPMSKNYSEIKAAMIPALRWGNANAKFITLW